MLKERNGVFRVACGAVFTLSLLSATPAAGQVACGATLTTSTTLTGSAPVVFNPGVQPGDAPCPGDGLILGASSITLNCRGLTIRGRGGGIGIQIARGVEGTTIVNCVVEGFNAGIQLGGLGSHFVEESVVNNNTGNGVVIRSDFNFLSGIVARKNAGFGFQVRGTGNEVDESIAVENGRAGFSITGQEHFFDSNLSILNGAEGVVGRAGDTGLFLTRVISNKGDGINFKGCTVAAPNDFGDNQAIGNGGNGILVENTSTEACVDDGGNRGLANAGPIQCQIAGQPCQ